MNLGAIRHERVPGLGGTRFVAFTTTRQAGSFDLRSGEETPGDVSGRWSALLEWLRPEASRLASAHQVHGDRILVHAAGWTGWLHDASGADGHLAEAAGTAMAVTLADCVPVFMTHPSGIGALVHCGWRGTAAGLVDRALELFRRRGLAFSDIRVHLGPAICGRCYVVGPDVYHAVTGNRVREPTPVDLRGLIAAKAGEAGATVTVSEWCTRCHNDRFFSHRAGDRGRHLGGLVAVGSSA